MDWMEALEIEVGRSKHERWRVLTADEHPDHEQHRRRVVELATGLAPTPAEYPSLLRQAANLAGAVGRVATAAAHGEPIRVPPEIHDERLAICRSCDQFDAGQSRCRLCGCYTTLKLQLATERCPLDPPKWGAMPQ